MGSIFSLLNTSRLGLYAQQTAMSVTGNNIANVNTPGYSRQRVVMDSLAQGGVLVKGVERLRDGFLTSRLRDSNGRLAASQTMSLNMQQIEAALDETEDNGLSKSMRDFFNALHDLTLRPDGSTEREKVRSQSLQMIDQFRSLNTQLSQIRQQIDGQIVQQVNQVNEYLSQLAELNSQIMQQGGLNRQSVAEPGVNELMDRRDQILNELSKLVPVRTVETTSQGISVFVGEKIVLEGAAVKKFEAPVDLSNDGMRRVIIRGVSGEIIPMGKQLHSGSLGALIQTRDEQARMALDSIDRLAARMIQQFNLQHRVGTGLDGLGNRDFFGGLEAEAIPDLANAGGTKVDSAAILDMTQLTQDDYELRFTDPATFDIVNTSTGAVVSAGNAYTSGAAIDFDGLRVVVSNDTGAPAAGDVIHVNGYRQSATRIGLSGDVAGNLDAIAAGLSSASGDNRNLLVLADLGNTAQMGNPPNQTFEEYYDAARLRQAMATATIQQTEADEVIAQQQVEALVSGVSGVSLDEEATNIIQFQRAYEASSRVIRATDELLQALLGMI